MHVSAERSLFAALIEAESEEQAERFTKQVGEKGFSGFRSIVNDFRELLKKMDESSVGQVEQLLDRGRALIPIPGIYSPSWETIWDEFARIVDIMKEVFLEVSAANREGSWQVLMNNPFTLEGVTCHPEMGFSHAVYLYAFFRKDLKKNEYIKLQKVWDVRTEHGN